MTKPGNTKIMADNVPAAEAIVCTMLFSWTEWSWNFRNIAMEITAAGIEVANVNPTFNPKYTFAAVKINVINPPRIIPRTVSSLMPLLGFAGPAALVAPVGVIARILSLSMFRTVLYDRDGSVSYGAGMGFAPYFRESTSSSPV